MSKTIKVKEAAEKPQGPKLHLKDSGYKFWNFLMFSVLAIAAYILWFSGQTTTLKVLAVGVAVDAAIHAYKLVAVVK